MESKMIQMDLPIKNNDITISKWEDQYAYELFKLMRQLELEEEYISDNLKETIDLNWKNKLKYECMITENIHNNVIGLISVKLKYLEDNMIEIGYVIDKEHWNMGYATSAVKLIVKYIHEQNRNVRILAAVNSNNYASIKVLKKCGFIKVGRTKIVNKPFEVYECKLDL